MKTIEELEKELTLARKLIIQLKEENNTLIELLNLKDKDSKIVKDKIPFPKETYRFLMTSIFELKTLYGDRKVFNRTASKGLYERYNIKTVADIITNFITGEELKKRNRGLGQSAIWALEALFKHYDLWFGMDMSKYEYPEN